jgi:dTDP-4-dehydrorhamnose reductase
MKILLLGANGQVGWELTRSLLPLGDLMACARNSADLTDLAKLRIVVRETAPTIIVNAAAYTAVDKAESEPELAHRINAEAVDVLAEEARRLGAWLMHYSTDYVFDGTTSVPYVEDDKTNPLNVYGRTKLQGEKAIRAKEGCRHIIFRTSWVFSSRGSNFVRTILRLARERDELKVVSDQIGAPTSAELIADVSALVIRHIQGHAHSADQMGGTYHLVANGETSWHQYAEFVLTAAGRYGDRFKTMAKRIVPITTSEYPSPAKRPLNSRLDTGKLVATFSLTLPPWQMHVSRAVAEIFEGGCVAAHKP